MKFFNAVIDCILNVLSEGYDATDAELIRESLESFNKTDVEKFISIWEKLSRTEQIALMKPTLGDQLQCDWLSKHFDPTP